MEPSVHDYLPTAGMETMARAAPLGEGAVLELPLLLLPGVVLFPGESLPLRVHSLDYTRLLLTLASQQQRSRASGHHLGVLNMRQPSHLSPSEHPQMLELRKAVGTTAELIEVETAGNWSVEEGMAAKARGRHRFRIIPPGQPGHGPTMRQGVLWAHVQILAEDRLSPLSHAYPLPRPIRAWALQSDKAAAAAARFATTYWPPSVWRQFDPHLLMARAQAILQSVAAWEGVRGATGLELAQLAQEEQEQEQDQEQASSLPAVPAHTPVAFSFRLAANLPLDDELRQRLLAADTLVDRLRLLLFLLKESATRRLCCAHCRRPLATKPTVFSVPGAEGTVGAYVNAHGFVHQTLTLRELLSPERVVLDGQPESRDSWFGGYAWQIAYCARCMLHLGWYFTPQQEQLEHEQEATPSASAAAAAPTASSPHRPRSHSQPPDRPPFFWGLRRAALVDETLDAPADDEEIDAALLWLVEAGGHMDGDSDSQTDAADGGGEVEEGSSGGGGGGGETSREASEEEED